MRNNDTCTFSNDPLGFLRFQKSLVVFAMTIYTELPILRY